MERITNISLIYLISIRNYQFYIGNLKIKKNYFAFEIDVNFEL